MFYSSHSPIVELQSAIGQFTSDFEHPDKAQYVADSQVQASSAYSAASGHLLFWDMATVSTRTHKMSGNRKARARVIGMAARVPAAAALHWSRKLPVLISGVPLIDPLAVDDSVGMRKQLELRFGVPLTWHERPAMSTGENAAYTKCILERHGISSIALATDANHMIRARLWHQHYGFKVAPIVSNSTSWRKPLPRELRRREAVRRPGLAAAAARGRR